MFGDLYNLDTHVKITTMVHIGDSLALLITFKPNYRFLVGIAPNGKVFEISNTSRPPATEERYFSTAFIYSRGLIMRPDAEGDKTSDCVFEKLLETLEFKNTESKK